MRYRMRFITTSVSRAYMTVVIVLFFINVSHTNHAHAAPKADLWDYWLPYNSESTRTVDHTSWDRFLMSYLMTSKDGINRIAYGKVKDNDKKALTNYIAALSNVPVLKLNREEQRAYWINLYNALTVDVVLDHYPIESIRDIDISPGFFSDGPWGKKLIRIDGKEVSLDDIEHRILRPIWKDPRIHYAVNCASLGCPNLQEKAFTPDNAEDLLEKGAREYVNHQRGVWFKRNKLNVSSIYKWFISDFGGNDAGVIEHLKKYALPELMRRLENVESISDHDYDWSLNEANH